MTKFDHGTQVGGTHYSQGDKPQHWDLVVMYDWDYFQAQITKYLMRWKVKYSTAEKRLEDLKKARNFLDKYIQEAEHYQPTGDTSREWEVPTGLRGEWQIEGYHGSMLNDYRHIASRNTYRVGTFQEALDLHAIWVQANTPPPAPKGL